MATGHLIAADDFCTSHNIEVSFITSLSELGLVQMTRREERYYIDEDELNNIEKMMRLHYDLNINFEGLEAINHLLNRVEDLQHELQLLQNRLRFYEEQNRLF